MCIEVRATFPTCWHTSDFDLAAIYDSSLAQAPVTPPRDLIERVSATFRRSTGNRPADLQYEVAVDLPDDLPGGLSDDLPSIYRQPPADLRYEVAVDLPDDIPGGLSDDLPSIYQQPPADLLHEVAVDLPAHLPDDLLHMCRTAFRTSGYVQDNLPDSLSDRLSADLPSGLSTGYLHTFKTRFVPRLGAGYAI